MNELTIGSGDEASLSIGTLMGNVEGGPSIGEFEGKVYKKTLETSSSRRRGPLGKLWRSLTEYFKR